MELTELIVRVYPWWEMQRVREQGLGSSASGRRMSNEWRHASGLVDHTHREGGDGQIGFEDRLICGEN